MATDKKMPITQVGQAEDKKKALEAALAQIEKNYGKGAIMLLPLHSYALFSGLTVDVLGTVIILFTTVYSGIEYFVVNKTVLNFKD